MDCEVYRKAPSDVFIKCLSMYLVKSNFTTFGLIAPDKPDGGLILAAMATGSAGEEPVIVLHTCERKEGQQDGLMFACRPNEDVSMQPKTLGVTFIKSELAENYSAILIDNVSHTNRTLTCVPDPFEVGKPSFLQCTATDLKGSHSREYALRAFAQQAGNTAESLITGYLNVTEDHQETTKSSFACTTKVGKSVTCGLNRTK